MVVCECGGMLMNVECVCECEDGGDDGDGG